MIRINFYISTVVDQIGAFSSDTAVVQLYANVFAWILPGVGVMSVPLVGFSLDKLGIAFSMWAVVVSGSAAGAMTLFNFWPIQLQIGTFVLWAVYRALLYSVTASVIAQQFPFECFGTLYGIMFFVAGLVNLSLIGAIAASTGNFVPANIGMEAVGVASAFIPWYLGRSRRRVEESEENELFAM